MRTDEHVGLAIETVRGCIERMTADCEATNAERNHHRAQIEVHEKAAGKLLNRAVALTETIRDMGTLIEKLETLREHIQHERSEDIADAVRDAEDRF